jgi:hypothetical protein
MAAGETKLMINSTKGKSSAKLQAFQEMSSSEKTGNFIQRKNHTLNEIDYLMEELQEEQKLVQYYLNL